MRSEQGDVDASPVGLPAADAAVRLQVGRHRQRLPCAARSVGSAPGTARLRRHADRKPRFRGSVRTQYEFGGDHRKRAGLDLAENEGNQRRRYVPTKTETSIF